jgi:hypothetical protein
MILAGVVAEEVVHGGGGSIAFGQVVNSSPVLNSLQSVLTGVAVGDVLLGFLQIANRLVTSVTDDKGNTWTILQNQTPTEVGAPFNIVSAWTKATASGTTTVSFNLNGTGAGAAVPFACVAQYTGSTSGSPIVASFYNDVNTSGNPSLVGAMSPVGTTDFVILFSSIYTTGCTFTPSAGFTSRTGSGGSVIGLCDGTGISGSATPTLTLGSAQHSFALGIILKV